MTASAPSHLASGATASCPNVFTSANHSLHLSYAALLLITIRALDLTNEILEPQGKT
jgi:hypothetical protein